MTNHAILLQKANSIQNCLKRIRNKTAHGLDQINDLDVQDIVVVNLQRATQLAIHMASHIVSTKRLGISKSMSDCIQLLEQSQWISHGLSKKMQGIVDFHKIAVYRHEAIDLEALRRILQLHLKDFEEFYTAILNKTKS